jgi:hypothetical protein
MPQCTLCSTINKKNSHPEIQFLKTGKENAKHVILEILYDFEM